MHRKDQAKYILHNSGLLRELQKYGAVHVIGRHLYPSAPYTSMEVYDAVLYGVLSCAKSCKMYSKGKGESRCF